MTRIRYTLADGSVIETEVSEAVVKLMTDLKRQEGNESRKIRWRKERSIENMAEYGVEITDCHDILTELTEREQRELLLTAVKRLKPQQQKIIYLVYFQGMQKQEIARKLGVSNGAITQQIATIHKKLKGILEET